jgi:segregation and condensation protein A
MSYNVKLEKFEGPMELLLDLIEKEKMSITELSLASVADEYLEYIKNNDSIHLEHLAEFLSVASKLILIKSRAILPTLKFTDEEETEIKDLTHQIEQYKKFKEAAQNIGKRARIGKYCFSKPGFVGIKSFFYPPEGVNAFDLKKNFLKILSEIPIIEKLQEEIVAEVVTLEEKIGDLEKTLRKRMESSFSDLVSEAKEKIDVIVSFLAVLEMVKQRIINVEQDKLFSDIKLSLKNEA